MADIKISELEPTTDLEGLYTIGSDKNNLSKKVSLQFLKDAANYANEQGDYAKQAGDTVNGNVGVSDYPEFSASQSYVIGDIVRYNGVLYAFTANHAASAWNGSDVKATSINAITSGKLTELESEVIKNFTGTRNFINPYNALASANFNVLNGVNEDNTFFNYDGKSIVFEASSSLKDCRLILQKLPSGVRKGAKVKIFAEIYAENLPSSSTFIVETMIGGASGVSTKRFGNGYGIYEAAEFEITQSLIDGELNTIVLFCPIYANCYPGKLHFGRIYIGYDAVGQTFGEQNIITELTNIKDDIIVNKAKTESDVKKAFADIEGLKFSDSHNFIKESENINSTTAIAIQNGEVVENTIFNYVGKMVKYVGGETLKDCRFFLQYLPSNLRVGQRLKIFCEVYVKNATYANFRTLIKNVVGDTTTLKEGLNIYEVNNIEVTTDLLESQIGTLGVFMPLQSGNVEVYVGRTYIGIDGEGIMQGSENLDTRISQFESAKVKENLDYLIHHAPTILVNNNDRYVLGLQEGNLIANKVSCAKVLYIGNSFVSHVADESKGWTPTEAWGMAAETKEQDMVHQIHAMLNNYCKSEIAGIVNIVPWEGNPSTFDKSKLDYVANIDFDCVVVRVGENVSQWADFDNQLIDLLDNHILRGKANVPIFLSGMFSAETRFNNIASQNAILRKVSEYYKTPFVEISVNTGTPTNIYSAILSPLPPKPDGSEWNKANVLGSVLNGHPGNLGHQYIAKEYVDAMRLYFKL